MDIRAVKLIYFSPTRTTKKILEGISRGIQAEIVESLDLTHLHSGSRKMGDANGEVAIIGVPVYAGRVPVIAAERLQRFKAKNTPAAVVVVYGNREFEDALLELRDLARKAGFSPIAAGAFIGEHSFSTNAQPIAPNRPDADDLETAKAFGEKIQQKLAGIDQISDLPTLQVPGGSPYKERPNRPPMSPVTKQQICTLCGECAAACPVEAITVEDRVETDPERCILCCACVKGCPAEARVMEAEPIRKIAEWLHANYSERKAPETFV